MSAVPRDRLTREAIVEYARTWDGVPYKHQGRSRETGVDCVGLIYVVADHFGLDPVDFPVYPRVPQGQVMLRELRRRLIEKPVRDRLPGDVLHLEMGKQLRHVGILTERNGRESLIHAAGLQGRVIEHALDRWIEKAHSCFAFPGLED